MKQESKTEKRGGRGRGQGRHSLGMSERAGASGTINFRVTQEQRRKYDERGGAAWLRKLIDAA